MQNCRLLLCIKFKTYWPVIIRYRVGNNNLYEEGFIFIELRLDLCLGNIEWTLNRRWEKRTHKFHNVIKVWVWDMWELLQCTRVPLLNKTKLENYFYFIEKQFLSFVQTKARHWCRVVMLWDNSMRCCFISWFSIP